MEPMIQRHNIKHQTTTIGHEIMFERERKLRKCKNSQYNKQETIHPTQDTSRMGTMGIHGN